MNYHKATVFLFLGLQESLPYDFSPSRKIKFAFQFFMPLPFKFKAEILHFLMYFCWKIILFHLPKLFQIFVFIPISGQQLFKKSSVNLKIKKLRRNKNYLP